MVGAEGQMTLDILFDVANIPELVSDPLGPRPSPKVGAEGHYSKATLLHIWK